MPLCTMFYLKSSSGPKTFDTQTYLFLILKLALSDPSRAAAEKVGHLLSFATWVQGEVHKHQFLAGTFLSIKPNNKISWICHIVLNLIRSSD